MTINCKNPEVSKRQKVLLVDDESDHLKLLESILEDDYELMSATNGAEALRFAARRPDLILLDLLMPDMDGFEVCRRLKKKKKTKDIPIIFLTTKQAGQEEEKGLKMGAVDFIHKPFSPAILKARICTHLDLADQTHLLEKQIRHHTTELENSRKALQRAMHNLQTTRIAEGVFWIQVPEANLYILCGCPGEVVKHLRRKGFISTITQDGVSWETGPNVILLSEVLVQNGEFKNLAEFPVLQMLYRQGTILPGHPNNTGTKPMIIGASSQVQAQMDYIYRGNYGLVSKEEIMASGVDPHTADIMMRIKLKFAFGAIRPTAELIDTLKVDETPREIRNGVSVHRVGFNRYQFDYHGQSTEVDLNQSADIPYELPYSLTNYRFHRHYFAVLHSGEGDGWNDRRPCMGGVIMFQGRIFLLDASPSVRHVLTYLGIDISEVEGIFHTHAHDDHFAGLPALIHCDRRLKYFATPLVRHSVIKKFSALMSMPEEKFGQFFDIQDLTFDTWNRCEGLEVMPLYSPHPLENNIFLFRAMDAEGYKTYAHWADLTSFKVLDSMAEEGPQDVPWENIEKIKADYLQPATLKKLDVGGGLIHGLTEDFQNDPSERLLLSHTDRILSIREMEIGSETSFGALDVLIPERYENPHHEIFQFLRAFFPNVDDRQIRMLLNSPIIQYNAGTIIHAAGETSPYVEMILSGTVVFLETEANISNRLSYGSFISGDTLCGEEAGDEGTFRAVSHCSTIRFSISLLRTFLEENGLLPYMQTTIDKVRFLRKTWLFGEHTTFMSLGRLARSLERLTLSAGEEVRMQPAPVLWLLISGQVWLVDDREQCLEKIEAGGFCGEHTYLSGLDTTWKFKAASSAELYRLQERQLLDLPIVHWKMLEVLEKRQKLLVI